MMAWKRGVKSLYYLLTAVRCRSSAPTSSRTTPVVAPIGDQALTVFQSRRRPPRPCRLLQQKLAEQSGYETNNYEEWPELASEVSARNVFGGFPPGGGAYVRQTIATWSATDMIGRSRARMRRRASGGLYDPKPGRVCGEGDRPQSRRRRGAPFQGRHGQWRRTSDTVRAQALSQGVFFRIFRSQGLPLCAAGEPVLFFHHHVVLTSTPQAVPHVPPSTPEPIYKPFPLSVGL